MRPSFQLGFETPTPIQAEAIPLLMEGHDLIGLAQTGTGKTAAFGLPMIEKMLAEGKRPDPRNIRALDSRPDPRTGEPDRRQPEGLRQQDPAQDRPRRRRRVDQQAVRAACARRRHPRRHARPPARPRRPPRRRPDRRPATSCSTKPTRCSTSASSTTCARSPSWFRRTARRMLFSATMPKAIADLAAEYLSNPASGRSHASGQGCRQGRAVRPLRRRREPEDRNPQEDAHREPGWPRHGLLCAPSTAPRS